MEGLVWSEISFFWEVDVGWLLKRHSLMKLLLFEFLTCGS